MDKITCNICGAPRVVAYQEQDKESGKIRTMHHTVDCMGHHGVHPKYWNKATEQSSGGVRTVGFQAFEKLREQQAKERPHVEKNEERIEDIGKRKEKKRKTWKPRKDNFEGGGKKRVLPNRKRKGR